ncbi:hypothetical protein [Deinococcus altitudinis]|uniref:hypothetical protein n=1 Tax=Deinococcus altitudinis TaxID=468914 RepID=UPI0038919D1A
MRFALLVGTIETTDAEGQYSAWIMFDLPPGQQLPDEVALEALGWRRGLNSVGPGLSTSPEDAPEAPEAAPPDRRPTLSGLYLHQETRTVLFIRSGLLGQNEQVTWELDTGQSYEHLSREPRNKLVLPALRHPAGSSVSLLGGGWSESDTLTHSAESVLITWAGTAAKLHTHYAAQLTAAGWVNQTSELSESTSTWSFGGGAGQGSLTLQRLLDGHILAQLTALLTST